MTIPWVGVDLDGTLAKYDEWMGDEYIGEPILSMVNKVKTLIANGDIKVKIFTARVCHGEVAISFIKAWCKQVFGVELEITNVKDFAMLELWDDRCKQVIHNEGKFINEEKNLY